MTSKNQVTVPKAIVAALHLKPSSKLMFEIGEAGVVTLRAKSATFADLAKNSPKRANVKAATIEEMNGALGRGAIERYKKSAR